MDLTQIQPLLDWLTLHQQWVAGAVILTAFLESVAVVGVIIPGVVLLFGIGAIAGSGALGVWPTLLCAFSGAVLGDCISFFWGKALKERTRTLWPFHKYPHWIDNAEGFIRRHGGKSVVIGRFVGPVRPVVPIVAGMLDMSAPRFVGINLLSALAWAPVYMLPGFVFGASLRWGTQFPTEFTTLLLIFAATIAIGFLTAKLSHWHLSPQSRAYRLLHSWVEGQHNVRLMWYWLAERRAERIAFPLPFLTLFICSLIAICVLGYLASYTTAFLPLNRLAADFFSAMQHPMLDIFFQVVDGIASPVGCYPFISVLLIWLLFRGYISAALHATLVVLIFEGLMALLPPGPGVESSRNILMSGGAVLMLTDQVIRVTLISMLLAAATARELGAHQRWWVYGVAVAPILISAGGELYSGAHGLSDILFSAGLGFALSSATILSFGRHQTRAIEADWTFWCALPVALATLVVAVLQ